MNDEHVSILIGKEAISYFSIDNKNKLLSENIFLLRAGHPVMQGEIVRLQLVK